MQLPIPTNVYSGKSHKVENMKKVVRRIKFTISCDDPCNACATHSLPGEMPLLIHIRDERGNLIQELKR